MRINYAAIVVVAVLHWLLGALWYSPLLFANRWMLLVGKSAEQLDSHRLAPYFVAFGANLVMAYILALVCAYTGANTAVKGAQTAVLLWLGFVATTSLTAYLFEGRPKELFLINYGYSLVGLVVMGGVLGTWKKKVT